MNADAEDTGERNLTAVIPVPWASKLTLNGLPWNLIPVVALKFVPGPEALVKVVLTGDYEIKSISISDSAKKETQEIINDLIKAAYNNAKENLKKKSAEELSKITGGLNLPLDFKLPF